MNGSCMEGLVSVADLLAYWHREVKLTFAGSGQGYEAVPSRHLIVHVLGALALTGWHLTFSTDLSKKQWDKDSLFFKPGPPVKRVFFAVSFNETDKIRLIDGPNPQVTEAFTAAVKVRLNFIFLSSMMKYDGRCRLGRMGSKIRNRKKQIASR